MAEPSLTDIFGATATQTATTITIDKTDLAAVGLTAAVDNTAESLLSAIILLAKASLGQDTFDTNLDQSITVLDGFNSIITRDDGTGTFVSYRQTQFNINLHNLDSFTVNPDDF